MFGKDLVNIWLGLTQEYLKRVSNEIFTLIQNQKRELDYEHDGLLKNLKN